MWHKAEWKGRPMRLELTRVGLLVKLANHYTTRRSRQYPTQTLMDADYTDDQALLANTPAQAESLLHNLKQVPGSIGQYVNANSSCVLNKMVLSLH